MPLILFSILWSLRVYGTESFTEAFTLTRHVNEVAGVYTLNLSCEPTKVACEVIQKDDDRTVAFGRVPKAAAAVLFQKYFHKLETRVPREKSSEGALFSWSVQAGEHKDVGQISKKASTRVPAKIQQHFDRVLEMEEALEEYLKPK